MQQRPDGCWQLVRAHICTSHSTCASCSGSSIRSSRRNRRRPRRRTRRGHVPWADERSRQDRDRRRAGTRGARGLMAKVEIVRVGEQELAPGYPVGHRVAGGVRHRVVSPAGFSLWMLRAELDDRSTIEWPATHGDEAVYVLDGALEIDGRVAPAQGAAIVESEVVTRARAVGLTRIVHMGPRDPAPPVDGLNGPAATDGHGVHVVGPRGTYANVTETADSHYYADSTCPTCRITLLSVGRSFAHLSEP